MRRKLLGVRHHVVGTSLSSLGVVRWVKGDLDGAEKLFRQALPILVEGLSPKHPDVAKCRMNLIRLLQTRGRAIETEQLLRDALAQRRTHTLLAMLGMCLLKKDRHADAEPILRECLALRGKQMPDHWLRYNAMSLLGESLAVQKKYAEAEPLLLQGYEQLRPPKARAHRKREALERVVKLYDAWGKPNKAKEWRAKGEQR